MAQETLRARNRRQAMRQIQDIALELFEGRGFEATTVNDIASSAGVSESTVYRYFGTKEHTIMWDEYDAVIGPSLQRHLTNETPTVAFRKAVTETLVERNDADLLRRVRLIYATPQLHAAAVERGIRDRRELSLTFAAYSTVTGKLECDVLAGCCTSALDAATDHSQQRNGNERLDRLISQAFDTLIQAS
jgi:AcrR family transcriptional regulator